MPLVRHPVLPIETIVIAKASQETRPHALIIALDNEQLTMVDTGSLYTIIPFAAWKRMHDAGLASALVEKTDNVQFVSATGDDLGYTHCAVLYLQVAGESRPVNAKVVSKMDDSFPFLLGLQGLTTLGGVVHTPTSTVTFTARNGSAVGYSYEPVEEEAPLLPPVAAGAALAVKRAGSRRGQLNRTAWASGMAVMLLATTAVAAPTTTTASDSHSELWQSIMDESFDNSVVLQDPMLDPDLPLPTSGWNPDQLSAPGWDPTQGRYDDTWAHPKAKAVSWGPDDKPFTLQQLQAALREHNNLEATTATPVYATRSAVHAPVVDPVFDPLNMACSANETSNPSAHDESYMTLLGSLGRLTYTTAHREHREGVDIIVSQFDDHGNPMSTTVTSQDGVNQQTTTATLCSSPPGLSHTADTAKGPVHTAAPVYRDTTGTSLWDQLGLDTNEWANRPEVKLRLQEGLRTYGDLFRPDSDGKLRRINKYDGTPVIVTIQLEDGASHRCRAYKTNAGYTLKVEDKIRELHEQGHIRPANTSRFGSSLLVVPKPDGEIRMTIDYRAINGYIKPYSYPCCSVQDCHNRLGGSERYTALDGKSWFYQFTLAEHSRECTTFVTPTMGCWCWNVLPMGLNISPAVVQSFADELFRVRYDGPGELNGCWAQRLCIYVYR